MAKQVSITKEFLIEEYANKGKDSTTIAKEVGLTKSTIQHYRKKYGIKTNPRHKNIANQKFGYLTAIKCSGHSQHRMAIWECLCVCGNICQLAIGVLTSGNTKSCGCKRYQHGDKCKNWTGYGEISGNFWHSVINNAEMRKIDLSIDIEYAWNLFLLQNRKCVLTKLPIYFKNTATKEKGNASLDRIDSSLSYSKENIQWLCKEVNIMKHNFDTNYFLYLCHLVSNYKDNMFLPELSIFVPENGKSNNIFWKGYGGIGESVLALIKAHAKKKNIQLNIKTKDLWELYVEQNGRCALTGIPVYFKQTNSNGFQRTASLDRIDSNLGYCVGNIQWVHKSVNLMKNDLPLNKFKKLCSAVSANNDYTDLNLLVPSKEWHSSFERVDMHERPNKNMIQGKIDNRRRNEY